MRSRGRLLYCRYAIRGRIHAEEAGGGHRTGLFGKWHLAGLPATSYSGMKPKEAGFEVFRGNLHAALGTFWDYDYSRSPGSRHAAADRCFARACSVRRGSVRARPETCEFYDLVADPLEEYPLAEPATCENAARPSPSEAAWHFCRLTEVIADHSFL